MIWLLACVNQALPPRADGLIHEDLSTHTSDTLGGLSIPFAVGSNSISTLVTCGPYGFDRSLLAKSVVAPDGSSAYDEANPGLLQVNSAPDQFVMLLSTHPDAPPVTGPWTLNLQVEPPTPTTVSCLKVERAGEYPPTPALEVHFVFVGTDTVIPNLDAVSALAIPEFGAMWEETQALWAPAFPVDPVSTENYGGEASRYSRVSSWEQVGELGRSVADDRSLTILVVPQINIDGKELVTAMLAPVGTAAIGGNSRAAVLLSVAGLEADPEGTGQELARAGAEFLGLFPVTEDRLEDTPECGDSDGDGQLSTEECLGAGAENLLWPLGGTQARELSEQQVQVLLRNPLLR